MNKKFLSFILILCLCIPLLNACSDNKNPNDVKNEITEFFSNESYSKIVNCEHDYPNKLQEQINIDEQYSILTTYDEILQSEFLLIKSNYGSFAVNPQNTNNQSTLCSNVVNSLNELKEEINNFTQSKNHYFSVIQNINLDNIIAYNSLKVYKQAYSSLIEKADKLNTSFVEAYISLYGNFNLENVDNPDIKSSVMYAYADFLSTYIRYAFTEFDGLHGAKTTFYDSLLDLINKLKTTSLTFNTANYNSWLELFKSYQVEKEIFIDALNEIDFDESQSTNDKEVLYKIKIENFININSKIIIDKTLQLIN